MTSPRRHVFISHHFEDDAGVDALTSLVNERGADVRNSSIRLKEANKQRIERGEVSDATIRRVLRRKISWAQTVVVLIGPQTHSRAWVDYEIEEAHRQGKRIVGVYARGETGAEIPPALERYASSIVGWNAERILDAIDGSKGNRFETPDGNSRPPVHQPSRNNC